MSLCFRDLFNFFASIFVRITFVSLRVSFDFCYCRFQLFNYIYIVYTPTRPIVSRTTRSCHVEKSGSSTSAIASRPILWDFLPLFWSSKPKRCRHFGSPPACLQPPFGHQTIVIMTTLQPTIDPGLALASAPLDWPLKQAFYSSVFHVAIAF